MNDGLESSTPDSPEDVRGAAREHASLRRSVAAAALVMAALLAVLSIPVAMVEVVRAFDERARFSRLTPAERVDVPGRHFVAPEYSLLRRFRARLQPGQTYALIAPPPGSPGGTEAATIEIFALYYLYPAIRVRGAADADAVLSLRTTPVRLPGQFGPPTRVGGSGWMAIRQ